MELQSTSLAELLPALRKFRIECPTVPKNAKNPHFNSSYADLPSIIETCTPILDKHDLVVLEFVFDEGSNLVILSKLMHKSGEFLQSRLVFPKHDNPQKVGSTITYARRYNFQAVTGIAPDDDDDGNAASQPQSNSRKPEPQKKKTELKTDLKIFSATQTAMVDRVKQLWGELTGRLPDDLELTGICQVLEGTPADRVRPKLKELADEWANDSRKESEGNGKQYIPEGDSP